MDEETRNAAGGALQLIVDGLDAAKREAGGLREQAYEQQELRRAAEYRAEQLSQALRSVCTELLMERGCYEGECGTYACSYSDCAVGPALKLLEDLEREARNGQTPTD